MAYFFAPILQESLYTILKCYDPGIQEERSRYIPGKTPGERENHSKLKRNNHFFYYCVKALQ
jgi:hypothetical protein